MSQNINTAKAIVNFKMFFLEKKKTRLKTIFTENNHSCMSM